MRWDLLGPPLPSVEKGLLTERSGSCNVKQSNHPEAHSLTNHRLFLKKKRSEKKAEKLLHQHYHRHQLHSFSSILPSLSHLLLIPTSSSTCSTSSIQRPFFPIYSRGE